MDSFTVAPELEGTKGDIIAARIEVPILVATIYGVAGFVRWGWSKDYYLYTYAPVLGGIAASVGLFIRFSCIGRSEAALENSSGSARISSIHLFAVHHRGSWPVHDIRRRDRRVFILVDDRRALLDFCRISPDLSVLSAHRDRPPTRQKNEVGQFRPASK